MCYAFGIDPHKYLHKPIYLWSLPGGTEQFPHLDYPRSFKAHAPDEVRLASVISYEIDNAI